MDLEKTLVLIKPDGVERGLIGQIIARFEQAGLKIIGLKMRFVNKDFAKQHYTEDLSRRRGEKVRERMVDMLVSGPVVALALEGVEAIALVRKMAGKTEPKEAAPGTIRGDFAHTSYQYADAKDIGVKNVVHASANKEDAASEVNLWFSIEELVEYHTVHEKHIFG